MRLFPSPDPRQNPLDFSVHRQPPGFAARSPALSQFPVPVTLDIPETRLLPCTAPTDPSSSFHFRNCVANLLPVHSVRQSPDSASLSAIPAVPNQASTDPGSLETHLTYTPPFKNKPTRWSRRRNSTKFSAYAYPIRATPVPCDGANILRQVSPNATEQELKKAYKTGALKHHPGMYRSLKASFAPTLTPQRQEPEQPGGRAEVQGDLTRLRDPLRFPKTPDLRPVWRGRP